MYEMRPADAGDEEAISAVVRARMVWMRGRGVSGWPRTEADVGIIASQAADPDSPVWVLVHHAQVVD